MSLIRLYNSLTKKEEEFDPINAELVTMYVCGPTVYDFVTIGNCRTYFLGDIVNRVLQFNGYKVKYIMNLTDVGHLTGDNNMAPDEGDDRLELAAEKEGRSAKEIANFYIDDFMRGNSSLNLLKPTKYTRATDYIEEQINLAKVLEKGGFTYKTTDGLYFDTAKFKDYGKLSGFTAENVMEGARVEVNVEKKNPTDFALWKLSPHNSLRWQEWDSPWGRGFPGWHLECSAMSMKELGETIDLHLGGEDLRTIHHQNEIAQSECATGKQFVKYWLHGAFLTVDNGRMGKSLGNAYTIRDIEEKGYDPLTLRYFYMSAHYRNQLNFTWEALQGAQSSMKRLYDLVSGYQENDQETPNKDYLIEFRGAINDDFNMPRALAVMWDLLKSEVSEGAKLATLLRFDEVLGFNIEDYVGFEVPQKVLDMVRVRNEYRKTGIWDKADRVRKDIEEMGYIVEDKNGDCKIKRKF